MSLVVAEPLQFRDFEEQNYARGFRFIAGIDEAGRGPLAGPVVAAAVILPRGFLTLKSKTPNYFRHNNGKNWRR